MASLNSLVGKPYRYLPEGKEIWKTVNAPSAKLLIDLINQEAKEGWRLHEIISVPQNSITALEWVAFLIKVEQDSGYDFDSDTVSL